MVIAGQGVVSVTDDGWRSSVGHKAEAGTVQDRIAEHRPNDHTDGTTLSRRDYIRPGTSITVARLI